MATMSMRFDGAVYDPLADTERLRKQHFRILNLMKDQEWRTLPEISELTGAPPASISAQLRHMRKLRFGLHTVNKRHRSIAHAGLWEYQLILNENNKEETNGI